MLPLVEEEAQRRTREARGARSRRRRPRRCSAARRSRYPARVQYAPRESLEAVENRGGWCVHTAPLPCWLPFDEGLCPEARSSFPLFSGRPAGLIGLRAQTRRTAHAVRKLLSSGFIDGLKSHQAKTRTCQTTLRQSAPQCPTRAGDRAARCSAHARVTSHEPGE